MGKSKRIRSDRARLVVDNPDKYAKEDSARKAKITSIIIICVIALIIAITVLLVVLNETGTLYRSNVVLKSDNYKVDAAMITYMYYYQVNYAVNYYTQMYMMYGLDYSSALSYAQQQASSISSDTIISNASSLLVECEAARAAGVELGELEKRKVDEAIESLKKEAKDAGRSISALYGDRGVSANDIKNVFELQYLANKYENKLTNEMTDKYSSDEAAMLKYFNEHRYEVQSGSYIGVKPVDKVWTDKLSAAKDEEEFKKIFFELYAEKNIIDAFNTAIATPANSLVDVYKKVVAAEIIYELTGKIPEGVTFTDETLKEHDSDTVATTATGSSTPTTKRQDNVNDRLKKIFNTLYKDYKAEENELGATTLSSSMYTSLAAETIKLADSIKKDVDAAADAEKETLIADKVTEDLNTFYKKKDIIPEKTVVTGIASTVAAAITFTKYSYKIDGVTLDDASAVTNDILKAIYKVMNADGAEISDDLYDVFVTMAKSMSTDAISSTLTTGKLTDKTSYMYPSVGTIINDKTYADTTTSKPTDTTAPTDTKAPTDTSTPDASTTEPSPSETGTASGTESGTDSTTGTKVTTDKVTTVTATEEEKKTPASEEQLNKFDKWFFADDRKVNDTYTDESGVIFMVTKSAKDKTPTKNVGHILVSADTETAADTSDQAKTDAESKTEANFAEAEKEANRILAEYNSGDKTKDAFEALGMKYTDDSSVFYYNVQKGKMVEEFENWIYDPARKAGDTAVIKTEYGYHVMYFLGDGAESWAATSIESQAASELTALKTTWATQYKVSENTKAREKVFGKATSDTTASK